MENNSVMMWLLCAHRLSIWLDDSLDVPSPSADTMTARILARVPFWVVRKQSLFSTNDTLQWQYGHGKTWICEKSTTFPVRLHQIGRSRADP